MSYTKDGTGNPITSTGNALDINIKSGAGGGGGPATIADGADVAQGTTTDVAWSSGAGTVIALLKKIASAGGSAVSVADGADVAQGAIADVAVTSDSNGTLSAKLRGLVKILSDVWDSVNHRLKVDGSGVTQPVSGTFWQATQPVSGTVTTSPPANASTNIAQVLGVAPSTAGKIDVKGADGDVFVRQASGVNLHVNVDSAPTTAVTGTFFQATQPVSATSLPLPTGAALDTSLQTLDTDLKATQPRSITNFPATQPVSGGVTATEANGYLLQIYDQLVVMTSLLQVLVINSVQALPPGMGLSDPAELGNPIN